MLPLSHTYVSTRAAGKNTPLLILGSVLPDISATSSQIISRDKIHDSPDEFSDFINSKYPQFQDLSLGVSLHSQINKGADFYSDNSETGYANLEGAKISSEVAELINVREGRTSLVLAHNFIELAVDLHLHKNQKEIWNIYDEAIKNSKNEFPAVAKCLSVYLELDPSIVLEELNRLFTYLGPHNLTTKETAAKKVVIPLIKLRFKKEVSPELC